MDDPLVPSRPGTEELDRHYQVYAPGTAPLGRDTDAKVSDTLAALGSDVHSMDLILRVADPERAHENPQDDFWLRIRVFPGTHTIAVLPGNRVRFSGSAYTLSPSGEVGQEELTFSATLSLTDQTPGNIIGELNLAGNAGTTNGGTP